MDNIIKTSSEDRRAMLFDKEIPNHIKLENIFKKWDMEECDDIDRLLDYFENLCESG